MNVSYQYASPSVCLQDGNQATLGFSPDLSREERVSFLGKVKDPLIFREAMLMLRDIVTYDSRPKKKERAQFFAWLEEEIERRMKDHEHYLPGIRERLQEDMEELLGQVQQRERRIEELIKSKQHLERKIDKYDIWREYYKLERDFWKFIKERDMALWWVLDPVITVHPNQVSFEAFSLDESVYGCLSIPMENFELLEEPQLGTTNIDFSAKLAKEVERFRTYSEVELSINPKGFFVDSEIMPQHLEKKIDLPDTWIKGFNQVSAAASLGGMDIELSQVDMYDLCAFLRRHKEHESPRYMKWIMEPGKQIRILLEPFGKELVLKAVYTGEKRKEEKVWGKRRWLVMEKLLPIAKSFKVRLLGFGMPQFIIADLGVMKMTVGFSSWSANDWVKGTAFNILGGFIGNGDYEEAYKLLKEKRSLSLEELSSLLGEQVISRVKAGAGMLFKRGEAYFDPINESIRFRQLCNTPLPKAFYETTEMEEKVQKYLEGGMEDLRLRLTEEKQHIATQSFITSTYTKEKVHPEITIDQDGQIVKVSCGCREFKKGARNISEPCAHILALYINASKFLKVQLKPGREYTMKDIMEMLL